MKAFAFEIEFVMDHGENRHLLLARAIDKGNFQLTDDSTLGEYAIQPVLTMPRALDKEGNPRFDLFAFLLKQPSQLMHFKEGQIVELMAEEMPGFLNKE